MTIQQRSTTDARGASGMPAETWTTLAATVWMRREDIGGRERFQAEQLTQAYTTRWEMGYRADMDPEFVTVAKLRRLLYQGRTYDVVDASQIGRREGIELLTVETRA